jgi:hypothetical protein
MQTTQRHTPINHIPNAMRRVVKASFFIVLLGISVIGLNIARNYTGVDIHQALIISNTLALLFFIALTYRLSNTLGSLLQQTFTDPNIGHAIPVVVSEILLAAKIHEHLISTELIMMQPTRYELTPPQGFCLSKISFRKRGFQKTVFKRSISFLAFHRHVPKHLVLPRLHSLVTLVLAPFFVF